MKHRIFTPLVVMTIWWGIGENIAQAQTWQLGSYSSPQVRRSPAVSPYINLANGGASALDYYGIVRPQLEANRSIGQLQQGLLNLQTTDTNNPSLLAQGANNSLGGLQTGHSVTYMNYQRFFPLSYGTSSGNTGGLGGSPTTGATGSQGFRPFYSNALNSYPR